MVTYKIAVYGSDGLCIGVTQRCLTIRDACVFAFFNIIFDYEKSQSPGDFFLKDYTPKEFFEFLDQRKAFDSFEMFERFALCYYDVDLPPSVSKIELMTFDCDKEKKRLEDLREQVRHDMEKLKLNKCNNACS